MQDGHFATNVELAEAEGYERSRLAKKFWNLYHDFSDEARKDGYLSCLAENPGRGFPEESAWITEQLKKTEFRATLLTEYQQFLTAHQENRDLLRFHYHRLDEMLSNLRDLDLPRQAFSSELRKFLQLSNLFPWMKSMMRWLAAAVFPVVKAGFSIIFSNPIPLKKRSIFSKRNMVLVVTHTPYLAQ